MQTEIAKKHRLPDWDDLRVFLAVARTGTLSGAARVLGVNHSTVFRRLGSFEKRLGVRLFDRLPHGYVRTNAGDEMLAAAEAIEEQVMALERRVTGRDLELRGTLRVTTTDTIGVTFGPPHIAAFRKAYPGIQVELVAVNQRMSLSRRDADVAIRPTNTPPEALVGRRVARIAWAVYAPKGYRGVDAFAPGGSWVDVDESFGHLALTRWVSARVPAEAIALRANSMTVLREACRAGLGFALLPCYMGDGDAGLRRVGDLIPDIGVDLWLLTHEDLRQTARVRAFLDFMGEAIARDRDLIEGRRPRAGVSGTIRSQTGMKKAAPRRLAAG
jgi:DNA-binding transcriptional LysR family regulator